MTKKKFKFSVIIPIYNVEQYLEETIESVLNQTLDFQKNIEMILVNDGSPDNSEEICLRYQKKYPDNIVYIKQKNAGVSAARNHGLEHARGEFTTFLDSDDMWSRDSFKEVYRNYEQHPEISIFSCKMKYFDLIKKDHILNYKYKEDKIISILNDYNYPQLSSSSVFIKTDILKKYKYDKTIKYSEDIKLINEIIFDEQQLMVLKKPIYFYRKRFSGNSAIQEQTKNIDWYLVTPKEVHSYLLDLSKNKFGRVIEYFQYLLAYEMSWRIPFDKKAELSDKDRKEYIKVLTNLVKQIDDKIILSNPHLNFEKKIFLLQLKNQKNMIDQMIYHGEYVGLNDYQVSQQELNLLIIDQIYFTKNTMRVYGKLDQKYIPQKNFAIKNQSKQISIDYYPLTNDYNIEAFNKEYLHDYIGIYFELSLEEDWNLEFLYKENYLIPHFGINGVFTDQLPRSYHHEKKRTILFKNNKLYNQKRNFGKSFYYELRDEISLLRKRKFKSWFARLDTKIMRLFKKKEIWLISDRVDKADDNGEHFFKYMVKKHPECEVYYVLSKTSQDYERMTKIGSVLDPNSLKYKLLFHRSDYVVSAHVENYIYNPFGNSGKFIRDQYQFKYIFLQHGITKDDLSSWLNVNTKKMDMFVTACPLEYQSILKYRYYYGKDIVKLTGFPRFDGLLENSRKYKAKNQIMLSLTWRANLVSEIDQKTGKRLYNPEFKKTEYFQFLNHLMNDDRLLKVLKDNNYKIKFIPHPNVLVQLDDFTANEYVEFATGPINYQKEFCENKLLITDYSSVFFDFAYLKKSIIYYQEDREEFYKYQAYNEGYFDYQKMGFGPVFEEYDSFVTQLIKCIEKDCELEKKYLERIRKFFKFDDDKNCQRVYEEIKKL